LTEKVVFINRSSKVVKGGRRFNFSALIVVGDSGSRRDRLGKASEVADAIRRGGELARTQMVSVSLKDATVPHEVFCAYGGAKFCCVPPRRNRHYCGPDGSRGFGSRRSEGYFEQSLGSNNAANVVKATLKGLLSLRLREDIYKGRGFVIKKWRRPSCLMRLRQQLDFYATAQSKTSSGCETPHQAPWPGRIQRPRQNQRSRRQRPDRALGQFDPHRLEGGQMPLIRRIPSAASTTHGSRRAISA